MHKIYHVTWNYFLITTKSYSINNWQLTHLLALKCITKCRFMENTFLNHEPERSAMKQFCDLLRNIADRNIAKLIVRYIALLHFRSITKLQYRNIALSQYRVIAISHYRNIIGMSYMTIFVNLFSAKCDLQYVSSYIGKFKVFHVSCIWCMRCDILLLRIVISQW